MYSMIITILILTTIAVTFHKFIMKAVNNYEYDNTPRPYEDRVGQIYWDAIKEPRRFS
jgi:hypothetical protein